MKTLILIRLRQYYSDFMSNSKRLTAAAAAYPLPLFAHSPFVFTTPPDPSSSFVLPHTHTNKPTKSTSASVPSASSVHANGHSVTTQASCAGLSSAVSSSSTAQSVCVQSGNEEEDDDDEDDDDEGEEEVDEETRTKESKLESAMKQEVSRAEVRHNTQYNPHASRQTRAHSRINHSACLHSVPFPLTRHRPQSFSRTHETCTSLLGGRSNPSHADDLFLDTSCVTRLCVRVRV
jgi:hypothetical protein